MSETIIRELKDGILYLTLNRPAKKNALTLAMYQSLTEMLAEADDNPDVCVIHLTGSEDSFCAGNDIADFVVASRSDSLDTPGLRFLQQLHVQRKPIVAAVNGIAVGIGVTLLLHCDLVYSAKDAGFQLPFVDLALVPEGGSSALLPQMLGHRRAAELLLACEPFDAATAERYGIINRVFSRECLLAESGEMALRLARKPSQALQQAKAMMKANVEQPLDQVIPSEVAMFMERLASEEVKRTLDTLLGGK